MACSVFLLLWQLFLLYYSWQACFIYVLKPVLSSFNCLWAVTQKSQFKDCPGCLEVQMCTVRSMPSLSHLANTECPLTVKHCARCQAAFCNPGHYPSVNCLGLVPKGLSTEIGSSFLYSLILPTSCLLANLKSNLYFCLFLPFHLSNNSIVFYRIIAWGRRVFFFF